MENPGLLLYEFQIVLEQNIVGNLDNHLFDFGHICLSYLAILTAKSLGLLINEKIWKRYLFMYYYHLQ